MFQAIHQIWHSKDLRRKIIWSMFLLVIYRIATAIPVPGADSAAMLQLFNQSQLLGAFSMLTGGGMANFSIVLMGLSPYINASIILQLMTVVIPHLENLSKEGQSGYQKIQKYTRWLTLPLAFLQSYGMIMLINSQAPTPVIADTSFPGVLAPMMIITAGALFMVWLGEMLTEKGLGNGISLLIFAGIIAEVPAVIGQQLGLAQISDWSVDKLMPLGIVSIITVVLTAIVVYVTEGQRNIPVSYASRQVQGGGRLSVIPVRVNQAGMIPIIFAVSMITFPLIMARFFVEAKSAWVADMANNVVEFFSVQGWIYAAIFFLLCVLFTFFYVSITFQPEKIAENIQKRGGFVVGIRPGRETAEYLQGVSNRLNFFGGIFIGLIAIFPILLAKLFSAFNMGVAPLLIGGAGLLIIVGVALELMRQVKVVMVMQDYDKLY